MYCNRTKWSFEPKNKGELIKGAGAGTVHTVTGLDTRDGLQNRMALPIHSGGYAVCQSRLQRRQPLQAGFEGTFNHPLSFGSGGFNDTGALENG